MPQAEAPRTVVAASLLYLVAAALGVVGAVVEVVVVVPRAGRYAAAHLTALEGVTWLLLVVGVVIGIGTSALFALLAPRLRRGDARARILLLVLAVLQVFGVLSAAGLGAARFLVLAIAAILSVWRANGWFTAA